MHPARRCYAVSLNLLHNLHCSWSPIPLIFYHLIVSTICSCRLNSSSFPGVCLTWQPPILIIIHVFQQFALDFVLFEVFAFVFLPPSSRYFLNFFRVISQLLHRFSPILTTPTPKSTSWFTSISCYATCRCSHVTFKSYFSLLYTSIKLSSFLPTFCT